MSISAKSIIARCKNPDGKERIIQESLHYGVSNYAYADRKDVSRAGLITGLDFTPSDLDGCYTRLTERGIRRFCLWLNRSQIYPNHGRPYYGPALTPDE